MCKLKHLPKTSKEYSLLSMVTRSREGEAEHDSQIVLDAIWNSSKIGLCPCDPQTGRILKVNNTLCSFFWQSAEDLLSRSLPELFHPDDRAAYQDLSDPHRSNELDNGRMLQQFLRSDGGTVSGDLVVNCTRKEPFLI